MPDETPRVRQNNGFVPVSTMAHDLLQPLRTIIVNVQRLQRKEPALTTEANSGLQEVLAAARAQEQLIASLVEYDGARDANWVGKERGPLPMTIQAACLKVDAFRKLQNGTIDIASPLPSATVASSAARVLEKVLHNALKFRKSIATPAVGIEAWEERPGLIAIRVTDNGMGIDAKYRDEVFQPFSRLNPSSDFPGSGMGLAICARLMDCIGGTIAFEDPMGSSGANAVIRIPVKE